MNDIATKVRKPRYSYHDIRPDGGIYVTEWAIERQLSLASDYDEVDLVHVLLAMNPDLDESIRADIETLFDLGDAVADAEGIGEAQRYAAVDDYCEHLRQLAHLVRGTTNYSPVRRPRHVLGSVGA